MKTLKIILIVTTIFNFIDCCGQSSKKLENREFQVLLGRFRVVEPPLNYKKIRQRISSMTKEETIRFLHNEYPYIHLNTLSLWNQIKKI